MECTAQHSTAQPAIARITLMVLFLARSYTPGGEAKYGHDRVGGIKPVQPKPVHADDCCSCPSCSHVAARNRTDAGRPASAGGRGQRNEAAAEAWKGTAFEMQLTASPDVRYFGGMYTAEECDAVSLRSCCTLSMLPNPTAGVGSTFVEGTQVLTALARFVIAVRSMQHAAWYSRSICRCGRSSRWRSSPTSSTRKSAIRAAACRQRTHAAVPDQLFLPQPVTVANTSTKMRAPRRAVRISPCGSPIRGNANAQWSCAAVAPARTVYRRNAQCCDARAMPKQ